MRWPEPPRPRYQRPRPSTRRRSAPSRPPRRRPDQRGVAGQGGEAIRPHRSMTASLRGRPRDREGRRPPRADSTVRSRRSSPARSWPFGSTARLPRQHGHRRSGSRGPLASVTGCWGLEENGGRGSRRHRQARPLPATTPLQPPQTIALAHTDRLRRGRRQRRSSGARVRSPTPELESTTPPRKVTTECSTPGARAVMVSGDLSSPLHCRAVIDGCGGAPWVA